MSDVVSDRLRAHLDRILRGAIAAAAPGPLVTRALAQLELGQRVHVLAIGKAALPMLRAALDALGARVASALAVAQLHAEWNGNERVLFANHPVPGAASAEAGDAVHAFLAALGAGDVALVLLSGGTSALVTRPLPGLSLDDLASTTRRLMEAGADIHELNCVRKHLDGVKGGRLARVAAPARVVCLALSDVIGDDPAVIGSGPFSADPTTFADARDVLRHHGVWEKLPASVRSHLEGGTEESVKPGDPTLAGVDYRVIGGNRTAVQAAAALATELGFKVEIEPHPILGEARNVGRDVALQLLDSPAGTALVLGGETTVTVTGGGSGGRNQELALSAAMALEGVAGAGLGAAGTDGIDGISPAAGAIVDGGTVERLRALRIDPGRALALNDSYPALAAAGDTLVTGPTGTNVMDLVVALRA